MKMKRTGGAALLLAAAGMLLFPVITHAADLATASASVSPASVAPGGHGVLKVVISMVPGAHVNAHTVPDPTSIPTSFAPSGSAGITLGAPRYPVGKAAVTAGVKESLYVGRATIAVPFTIAKNAAPGSHKVGGSITFQACNDRFCLPPKTVAVGADVEVK